jgi:cytochrome P450
VHGIQLAARDEDHARMRKNLAPAFSDKAIRTIEPVVTKYITLLIHKLHERAEKPMNIEHWFNFTMFDLMGDLTFGESFGCLEKSTLHVSCVHWKVSQI